MAVSEASAIFNLAVKGVSVIADLRVGLYKGKVELDALEGLLLFLKAQHGLWSEQLPGCGLSEHKHLQPLVQETEKALQKIKTEAEKLQKSSLRRFKKKLLYREIIYFQEKITQIVNAGPKLLADHVDRNDVLQKLRQQTPPPLDFGPDRKYVPIADSVLAVRKAVENGDGGQVVTLYGGPGIGKTSLVKHLAILYKDDQKKRGMAATFPHGVYYLDCRKDAGVLQLLQELLGNLGFGAVSGIGSGTQNDSATTGTGVQHEDYSALRANRIILRSRLAEQKLLIILDNVWEPEVLDELIAFGKGVKYLVTSQKRNIYSPIDGTAIEISMPNLEQSCQIMANHTAGLPEEGKLPDNIKEVVRDIICKLKYHPLAVANIGMSIDRDRATDVEEWNRVNKHVLDCLSHENDLDRPHAFGSRYNLSVSASMTQVVASLPQQSELPLLFLVTGLNGRDVLHDGDLCHGGDVPEPILEFFYSFIEPNLSLAKRNTRCLVDKSLIHKSERGNSSSLSIHPLRRYYILQRNLPDVRSTVSQIFVSSGDQDVAQLVKRADREYSAAVFGLGAMYFDKSLLDVLAGAVITRGLNPEIDALDLVNNARLRKHDFRSLVSLLNIDPDAESWKRQANKSVQKIISKFFCQGKLDDSSMASLLEVPQTTSAACVALVALYCCHSQDFYARDIMFSEAYHETMQTLLRLFRNNAISMDTRRVVLIALLHILDYESDDTILNFAAEYVKLFAMEPNNNFRDAGTHAFASADRGLNLGRGIRTMAEFPGILETLFSVLGNGNDDEVQRSAGFVLLYLCEYRHFALKVAVLPDALKTLFHCYLSEDLSRLSVGPERGALFFFHGPLNKMAGDVLCLLSIIPENRAKLGAIEGIWDGLGDILTKQEEAWRSTTGEKLRQLKEHACQAAFILGYLGLEMGLREAITSFPGIREGLLFLQLVQISGYTEYRKDKYAHIYLYSSTRALTILYSEELGDPRAIDLRHVGDKLKVFSRDSCDEGNASITSRTNNYVNYLALYWSRALAYREMGSYAEALKILEVELIQKLDRQGYYVISHTSLHGPGYWWATEDAMQVFMHCKISLQAMVGDYAGALRCANRRLVGDIKWYGRAMALMQRGVVKRLCGDLQEALDDFNVVIVEKTWLHNSLLLALWQRGYVKYLMGDPRGAAADAELAQQHRHNICTSYPPWWLSEIRISYLGFSM